MTAETLDPRAFPRGCRPMPVSKDPFDQDADTGRTTWRCVLHGEDCPSKREAQ